MHNKKANRMKKKILVLTLLLFATTISQSIAQRTATLGELDKFVNGVSVAVRSTRLSDDRVLIFYKNSTASTGSTMKAVVGTISGSNISYGTTVEVATDAYSFQEAVALSPAKVAVFYEVNVATDINRYQILYISGDVITVNSAATLGDGDQISWRASLRAAALNEDLVVVTYERDGATDDLVVVAGTVSGSNVTWGTTVSIENNVSYTDITRLSSSKFALIYEANDGTPTGDGKIIAGTVSGNTITKGTAQTFESASVVGRLGITALSETEVVVAYEDDGSAADEGRIFYATISGTTFSFPGSTDSFYTVEGIDDLDIDALSATEILLAVDGGFGDNSVYYTGLLNSGDIDLTGATTFRAGQADDINVTALTSDLAVLNYTDDEGLSGTTDAGESRVITLLPTTNPEINVQGNGTNIALGDATPSTGDHTDFGTGASLSRTFTIQNLGTGTLTLGSDAVTISGTNSGEFSVNTQPATALAGNSSTTFIVDFSSAVVSVRNAEIHINSNDVHEPDYFFAIQAVGAAGDNTPPVFESSTPSSSAITQTGFALATDINEAGTIYYVVVPDGASTPTAANVKAGQSAGGGAAVTNGNATVSSGGFSTSFSVTSLSAGTAYDVYTVAEDDESTPNLQAAATKIDVTTIAPSSVLVAAKAFLEGTWNGSTAMNTILEDANLVSASAPYNGVNTHAGSESVASPAAVPDGTVDWVLVELREAISAATANNASKVGSAAGFLMSDGSIKATNGTSDLTVSLSGNSGTSYFVVVYHRNHLPIMSASAIAGSSGTLIIDFTSSSALTYQNTDALVVLSGGKFGMPAGDTDSDGLINNSDLSTWRTSNGGTYSYSGSGIADFNLDSVINAVDRNDFHQKNTSKTRQVPTL